MTENNIPKEKIADLKNMFSQGFSSLRLMKKDGATLFEFEVETSTRLSDMKISELQSQLDSKIIFHGGKAYALVNSDDVDEDIYMKNAKVKNPNHIKLDNSFLDDIQE